MQAVFDEDGYYTGEYAEVGELEGGVEVKCLPPEYDHDKAVCYRLDDEKWLFDEKRHQAIIAEGKGTELSKTKEQMIKRSKSLLKQFFNEFKLTSSCHSNIEQQYSITEDKQSQLHIMISLATTAQLNGADYQCSWNATGEDCTYDWTLEELQQLAFEIESVVRPLVSKQRELEVKIRQAKTLEELQKIDIGFDETDTFRVN